METPVFDSGRFVNRVRSAHSKLKKIDRLLAQVSKSGQEPCDVRFGREVVATLEAAERSLWSKQVEPVNEAPGGVPRA